MWPKSIFLLRNVGRVSTFFKYHQFIMTSVHYSRIRKTKWFWKNLHWNCITTNNWHVLRNLFRGFMNLNVATSYILIIEFTRIETKENLSNSGMNLRCNQKHEIRNQTQLILVQCEFPLLSVSFTSILYAYCNVESEIIFINILISL